MTAPPSTTACKCAAWPIASSRWNCNQAYGNTGAACVVKYRRAISQRHARLQDRRGGLVVYPRLVAADSRRDGNHHRLSSGIAELDAMIAAAWKKA
jgi:hypothetical protein